MNIYLEEKIIRCKLYSGVLVLRADGITVIKLTGKGSPT